MFKLTPKKIGCKALAYSFVAATLFIVWQYYGIAVVDGNSMSPTLQDKDYIFVEKIYDASEELLERGDVVGFSAIFCGNDEIFVKRIIGVPGDKVEIQGERVFVNNEELVENYVNFNEAEKADGLRLVVPKDCVFVLGDNRADSYDSRDYGPVRIERIISKVIGN